MEKFFTCPSCGEYAVSETTFNAFITPAKKEEIQKVPKVTKAILKFDKVCPKCTPLFTKVTEEAELFVVSTP